MTKQREQFDNSDSETPKSVIPPRDVVVYNEMRSCHDLWTMKDRGLLIIDPDFQRHNVWSSKDKSLFIDSLLKELPIPSICLFHDAPRNQKIVVDGLQRISAIISLLDPMSTWSISNVDGVDERIRGKSVKELRQSPTKILYVIEEKVLPVTVIRGDYQDKNHLEYLVQIFSRLNTGGKRLLNQELRNCVYRGNLNDNLKKVVRSMEWLNFAGMNEAAVDADRFGQEERILRLFAFMSRHQAYKRGLNTFLNEMMADYRNIGDTEFMQFKNLLFDSINLLSRAAIPELSPKKNWNVCEAAIIGIMTNLERGSFVGEHEIEEASKRYYALINNEDLREGVMQPKKVCTRIDAAIDSYSVLH